jgi:hypothetical protein
LGITENIHNSDDTRKKSPITLALMIVARDKQHK